MMRLDVDEIVPNYNQLRGQIDSAEIIINPETGLVQVQGTKMGRAYSKRLYALCRANKVYCKDKEMYIVHDSETRRILMTCDPTDSVWVVDDGCADIAVCDEFTSDELNRYIHGLCRNPYTNECSFKGDAIELIIDWETSLVDCKPNGVIEREHNDLYQAIKDRRVYYDGVHLWQLI